MRKHLAFTFMILPLLAGIFLVNVYGFSRSQAAELADDPSIGGRFFYKGLGAPLDMDFTGIPGDDRFFMTEKGGSIRITDRNYNLPFFDISEKVDSPGEKGMLGMVFDPDFANNNYFYVFYTGPFDNSQNPPTFTTYVERYTVSDDPEFADEDSGVIILQFQQQSAFHNGGNLAFGPDGYLYIGIGDDNRNDGVQDLNELRGKILRIDVNADTMGNRPADCDQLSGNYSIPADNPFVGQSACEEIWSYGFRNPWRATFDSATGDFYIGDVGEGGSEELDFQPASSTGGENYGWPLFEGNNCRVAQAECDALTDHAAPIFTYPHSNGWASITGGYVYRGSTYPNLIGHYIFGDFNNSQLWTAINENGVWNVVEQDKMLDGPVPLFISAFGIDPNGEVYGIRYTDGTTGSIHRIVEDYGFEIELQAPITVDPGANIDYQVVVTNVGKSEAIDVTVENVLPASVSHVSGGTLTDSTVSWDIPSIDVLEAVTLTWSASPMTQTVTNDNYSVSAASQPVISGTQAYTTVVKSGIAGRVFEDETKNGLDDGEPGIAGVDVILWRNESCDGNANTNDVPENDFRGQKSSAADGSFRFDIEETHGCYMIELSKDSVPTNMQVTTPNVGNDDSIDSDIFNTGGFFWTEPFTVPAPAVNAGLFDPLKPIPTITPTPTNTATPTLTPLPTETPGGVETPTSSADQAVYLPMIIR